MSQILLMQTVRDSLKTQFGFQENQCRVADLGEAPPDAGPVYLAVHPGLWRRSRFWKSAPVFDEDLGFRITISVKNSAVQPQLYGEWFLQKQIPISSGSSGLTALARAIATYLNDNDSILCSLSTQTGGGQWSGGIYFADGGDPTRQKARWWGSIPTKDDPPVGLSQTMTFDGARRTQATGSAT